MKVLSRTSQNPFYHMIMHFQSYILLSNSSVDMPESQEIETH